MSCGDRVRDCRVGAKCVISLPYLLVLNIALHHHAGRYWADPLWCKDLNAHLAEIERLTIACPVMTGTPPDDWQPVAAAVGVYALPPLGRLAILRAPALTVSLWRAIGQTRIVHTGVAGWPFPLGWLAIPLARARHRFVVAVVESAFWRLPPGAAASRLARARADVWERINRRLIAACDIAFFTTQAYHDTLGGTRGHVLPAVWIDDDQLIDEAELARIQPTRRGLLFAGRLTASKGVDVLLRAAERSGVVVDFVGVGDLRDAVLAAAERTPSIRLLEPVEYGPRFAALLDRYTALVVPTLTDEQPRVIFDAFARGLPVVASATPGNRQIVADGHDGILFARGDPDALALALGHAAEHPERLGAMGRTARAAMTGRTHAAMHAERGRLIAAALAK